MSDIVLIISRISGHFAETTMVNHSLRDEVREVGKEIGIADINKNVVTTLGGRFVNATIPEDRFDDLCRELGADYKVCRKIEPTPENN